MRLLPLVVLIALALPSTASAGVTTVEPSYEVIKEQNVVVTMSDGTRLVADVYRPKPKRAPCNGKVGMWGGSGATSESFTTKSVSCCRP